MITLQYEVGNDGDSAEGGLLGASDSIEIFAVETRVGVSVAA